MTEKRPVRCHCGQRILARDVLSSGYEIRPTGPNYVYVKFRCPRCRRLGEHLVPQSRWDWSLLLPEGGEPVTVERRRFRSLPPITVEEVHDFRTLLESPDALKTLK